MPSFKIKLLKLMQESQYFYNITKLVQLFQIYEVCSAQQELFYQRQNFTTSKLFSLPQLQKGWINRYIIYPISQLALILINYLLVHISIKLNKRKIIQKIILQIIDLINYISSIFLLQFLNVQVSNNISNSLYMDVQIKYLYIILNIISLIITIIYQQTVLVIMAKVTYNVKFTNNHYNIVYTQALYIVLLLQTNLLQYFRQYLIPVEIFIVIIALYLQFPKINNFTKCINIGREIYVIISLLLVDINLFSEKFEYQEQTQLILRILDLVLILISGIIIQITNKNDISQIIEKIYKKKRIIYYIPNYLLHSMKMSEHPINSGIYKSKFKPLERSLEQFTEQLSTKDIMQRFFQTNDFYERIMRIYESIYSNIVLSYLHASQLFNIASIIELEQVLSVQELLFYAERWKNVNIAFYDLKNLFNTVFIYETDEMQQGQDVIKSQVSFNDAENETKSLRINCNEYQGNEFILQNNEVYYCSSKYITSNITGITHKLCFYNAFSFKQQNINERLLKLIGIVNFARLLFPYKTFNGIKFPFSQTFTIKVSHEKIKYKSCDKVINTVKNIQIKYGARCKNINKCIYLISYNIQKLLTQQTPQYVKQYLLVEISLSGHIKNVFSNKEEQQFSQDFAEACNRSIILNINQRIDDEKYRVFIPFNVNMINDAIISCVSNSILSKGNPTLQTTIQKLAAQCIPYRENIVTQLSDLLKYHNQEYGVLSIYNIENYIDLINSQYQILKTRFDGSEYQQCDLHQIFVNSDNLQVLSSLYQYYDVKQYIQDTNEAIDELLKNQRQINIFTKEKLYNQTDIMEYIYQLLGIELNQYQCGLNKQQIDKFNKILTKNIKNSYLEDNKNLTLFKLLQNYQIQNVEKFLDKTIVMSADSVTFNQIMYCLIIQWKKNNSFRTKLQMIEIINKIFQIFQFQLTDAASIQNQMQINDCQNLQELIQNKIQQIVNCQDDMTYNDILQMIDNLNDEEPVQNLATVKLNLIV